MRARVFATEIDNLGNHERAASTTRNAPWARTPIANDGSYARTERRDFTYEPWYDGSNTTLIRTSAARPELERLLPSRWRRPDRGRAPVRRAALLARPWPEHARKRRGLPHVCRAARAAFRRHDRYLHCHPGALHRHLRRSLSRVAGLPADSGARADQLRGGQPAGHPGEPLLQLRPHPARAKLRFGRRARASDV